MLSRGQAITGPGPNDRFLAICNVSIKTKVSPKAGFRRYMGFF